MRCRCTVLPSSFLRHWPSIIANSKFVTQSQETQTTAFQGSKKKQPQSASQLKENSRASFMAYVSCEDDTLSESSSVSSDNLSETPSESSDSLSYCERPRLDLESNPRLVFSKAQVEERKLQIDRYLTSMARA